ncbi:SCO family protein [Paracoccus sp. 1_MG-2023]|uniref:SCO family protein n=2 Tax=unclassified Paracoccus (in: a-proteobacteria) TaxID=2688777 RepID=UPI0026E1458D|nr:SCO family protein [Paracoccus sp. 1_MG-2023]
MNRIASALAAAVFLALPATAQHHEHAHDHDHRMTDMTAGIERLSLPNFPVTSSEGVTAGLRDMLPHDAPLILSFTYTGCESLCAVTNAILLGVEDDLLRANADEVVIATISIDPANDTPEQLRTAKAQIGAGEGWLWLTGGTSGTKPILDTLRFPPGAIEDHDPIFLIGRPCSGRFTRVVGLADPQDLVSFTRDLPECEA